jgi:hypothetical protein
MRRAVMVGVCGIWTETPSASERNSRQLSCVFAELNDEASKNQRAASVARISD